MTTAARIAQPTPVQQKDDTRRIAEDDPDFVRLQATTRRKLHASVVALVRDLRRSPPSDHDGALSRFIQRHIGILRDAYTRAHQEGQRDYWQQVSLKPNTHIGPVNAQRMRKVLGFYAPSVAKMSREAQQAWHASQAKKVAPVALAAPVAPVALAALAAPRQRTKLTEGGAFRFADDPVHTGVMVAFMLPPDVAKQLAIAGGEPASDMHITLVYLGDRQELAGPPLEHLDDVVRAYASEAMPLEGVVSGLARFTPSPSSDGRAPIVALVNVPGIQRWRAGLVKRLKAAGIPVYETFEYTPHITLAYVAGDAPMPVKSVPAVALRLDQVTVAIGDEHQTFPVGDEQYPANRKKKTALRETFCHPDDKIWRFDDNDEDSGGDPLDQWLAGLESRIELQADLTWPALNDGYTDGPLLDPANPYYYLYWDLEPAANHCATCPDYAASSPYTPPGSGVNELDATPGDGHTECGAACKCSLRYGAGSPGDIEQLTWNLAWGYWQAHPDELLSTPPWLAAALQLPPPLVLPRRDDLSDAQKDALDSYREAMVAWDQVRGELPPLPGLFGAIDWEPPALDTLSPAQRNALLAAIRALIAWGEASDDAVAEAYEGLLREVASRDVIQLSNPYPRQSHGRFGFGPGGSEGHGGSGSGGGSTHDRPMSDAEFGHAMQHAITTGHQSLHGGGQWIEHGGAQYFVKDTGSAGSTEKDANETAIEGGRRLPGKAWQRELAANEIGQIAGLDAHQPRMWEYEQGGRAYLVSERIPGAQDLMQERGDYVANGHYEHEQKVADYLHSQPRDALEKLALHEYVTQNGDTHLGNLKRNEANGHVMALDREMSFAPSVQFNPLSSIVRYGLASHLSAPYEGVHLAHASIRAFTSHTDDILHVAERYGFSLDHLSVRLAVLHHLDALSDPTLGDLRRLSMAAYKGQL